MSKKDKGIATFASVIGYLVMLIAMNVWLKVTGNLADPETMSQVGQIQILGIQTYGTAADAVYNVCISGDCACYVSDSL